MRDRKYPIMDHRELDGPGDTFSVYRWAAKRIPTISLPEFYRVAMYGRFITRACCVSAVNREFFAYLVLSTSFLPV
jgi:hypothetical protein